MSKSDPLTPEEIAKAHSQGWMLVRVFDDAKSLLTILPIVFNSEVPRAEIAARWVSQQAMARDPLAIKALIAISTDALSKAPKPKRVKAKAKA